MCITYPLVSYVMFESSFRTNEVLKALVSRFLARKLGRQIGSDSDKGWTVGKIDQRC